MKKLIKWAEKRAKKLSIWDLGILKLDVFLLGLIAGAYISGFVQANVGILFAIFLVLYIYLTHKFFKN